ncbi:hypothetical protein ACFVIM_25315 [Streptomyces sp. NPDC057638]|uniref:hypothetical protein n=1 Tax=Streptomyces sp. NPDC057638 TaxID=3346190 RepID=UPI0036C58CD3
MTDGPLPDATTVMPPVTPGAMPPGAHGGEQMPSPRRARRARQTAAQQRQQPVPPAPTAAPYGIRPGAPGDRPAGDFDNLFREEAAPVPAPAPVPEASAEGGRGRGGRGAGSGRGGARRRHSDGKGARMPLPVIAAVVVGCAVVGLGAGALMFDSGSSGDGKGSEPVAAASSRPPAAPSPAPSSEASAESDPAKRQAQALDRLLEQSNERRGDVVGSVSDIKSCDNLDRSARKLRAAADDRRDLVDRLEKLSVRELPRDDDLTEALTDAWRYSAIADDHYAAWAKQVKSDKYCVDGKAKATKRAGRAERASERASKAKREAARLWNPIASRYGLPTRTSDRL